MVLSSLPPQVEGQTRCYVVVKIKGVRWTTGRHASNVILRILWWGENIENAALFRPTKKTVVGRYPVRSGPKQMGSYLSDAGTLHVDILRDDDMLVIGKVQVYGLSTLAMGYPLKGQYPIFSTKSDVIGHLELSIEMKALHVSDESCNNLTPSTDTTVDNSQLNDQVIYEERLDNLSPFSSILSNKIDEKLVSSHRRMSPTKDDPSYQGHSSIPRKDIGSEIDLISDLLRKGQRLRTAMVTSSQGTQLCTKNVPASSHYPHSRSVLTSLTNNVSEPKVTNRDLSSVKLVLGSPKKDIYLSDDSTQWSQCAADDLVTSDLEDPAHDQEILDLLFYKNISKDDQKQTGTEKAHHQTHTSHTTQAAESPASRAIKISGTKPDINTAKPDISRAYEDDGNFRPPSRTLSAAPSPKLADIAQVANLDSGSTVRSMTPGNQSDSSIISSRVSFDMTASDDEELRSAAEGLSVEQLTLLARVNVARVHIDKLCLNVRPETPTEKKTLRGCPPPAKPSKYGIYFVEYQFPVVASSRDHHEKNTSATETVRAVSKKVEKSGVVTWGHHSVFPVFFDGQAIEKWWNSMLVLKVHHREASSRTASLIGSCTVQMKQLLKSLTFGLTLELPVTKPRKRSGSNTRRKPRRQRHRADAIGRLTCSIQLDSDSPSFGTALRELQMSKARTQHPLLKPKPLVAVPFTATEFVRSSVPDKKSLSLMNNPAPEQENMMLYIALHISQARGLRLPSQQEQTTLNTSSFSTYTICRLFWSSDKVKSDVCWNDPTPNYRISELIPLHITPDMLKHMCNNYMIVEVWEKRTSVQKDQLIGYAKLPLNTFYMSYKEKGIADVLMKSEYPVTAVDNLVPIINPLTGKDYGELKVLLAVGTQQQTLALETLKMCMPTPIEGHKSKCEPAAIKRQQLLLPEREDNSHLLSSCVMEHRFDVKIVSVRDDVSDDSMYLGEADCFVQYHFPTQSHLNNSDDMSMKSFRSPTTLYTSNVTFDDHHCHLIRLSEDANLQTLLASVYRGVNYSSSIPFEMWCRFYHPNTRDQMMAKSYLPLSKLLALITMNGSEETVSCQSYSLPLMSSTQVNKERSVGMLDLSVRYSRHKNHQYIDPAGTLVHIGHVSLKLKVESVAGLKSAALALSHNHPCLEYFSTLGVNFYIKVFLSFIGPADMRISETEPLIFYLEEFGYQTQFSLPLIMNNNTSLAECLQTGHLIIQVWHQNSKDSHLEGLVDGAQSSDIQLGVCSVSLKSLLSHKTGIDSWFVVSTPPQLYSVTPPSDPVMGALKLQLCLGGSSDIANIIDSASKLGYQLPPPGLDTTDTIYDEMCEISIQVDWITLASHFLPKSLSASASNLIYYLKTSFYNNDVSYSTAVNLTEKGSSNEGHCEVSFMFLQTASAPFLWYMFDNVLELELWTTSNWTGASGDYITPSSSDKYLGTAYVPFEPISKRRQCSHSDVYPVFKSISERMGSSYIRVHCTRKAHTDTQIHVMKTNKTDSACDEDTISVDFLECSDSISDSLDENSIEATISIEEGNRVIIEKSDDSRLYVTYSLNGKEYKTSAVDACVKPVWLYEKSVRLNMISISQAKHLVMKLWCKSGIHATRVLGFTTIDLRPIFAGMPHLSGWYNIVDLTGRCCGQIKCGVMPIVPITRGQIRESNTAEHKTSHSPIEKLAKYITYSGYNEFPCHVTRFTEQRLYYNQTLTADTSPTDLLNKHLAELDTITQKLRGRLYPLSDYENNTVSSTKPPSKENTVVSPSYTEISAEPLLSSANPVRLVHPNSPDPASQCVDNASHSRLVTVGDVSASYTTCAEQTDSADAFTEETSAQDASASTTTYPHSNPKQSILHLNSQCQPDSQSQPLQSPNHRVNNESCSEKNGSPHSNITPRAWGTYSMSSDDDEQFSPPIYTGKQPSNIVGMPWRHNTTQEDDSDWSEDVKLLQSDSSDSEHFTQQVTKQKTNPELGLHSAKDEHVNEQVTDQICIQRDREPLAEEYFIDENQQELSDADDIICDQRHMVNSADDYEEEHAVSRTINDDMSINIGGGIHNKESASSDDSDVETEQVSQCVNSGSEQALIPSHHLPSQRENNMGVQTNESTEQESKSASQQASQPTSQPTSQPDSQQSASNIQHQVAELDCSDLKPNLTLNDRLTAPTFFPSKEELHAKLSAARQGSVSRVVDRFIRIKPINSIVTGTSSSQHRAKQVAGIFAANFKK